MPNYSVLHGIDSEFTQRDVTAIESSAPALRRSFETLAASGALGDSPQVFLSRLSSNWAPRILTVAQDNNLLGLVYAKERKILGVRTGLVYIESVLGTAVFAEPQYTRRVLYASLTALARHPEIKGLRLLTPSGADHSELAPLIAKKFGLDIVSSTLEHHAVLSLAPTYNEFLAGLHHNTRYNFRRYRKRSELAGHRFFTEVSLNEFEDGMWELEKESVFGGKPKKLTVAMAIYRAAPRPLLMGLRADDGKWLSLIGGWLDGHRAIVNLQMNNHQRYPKFSLSVVARGHAIEWLITAGYRKMVFYASVSEPLCYYTQPIHMTRVYLDKRLMHWRLFRHLTSRSSRVLKGWPSRMAEWIVPFDKDAGC